MLGKNKKLSLKYWLARDRWGAALLLVALLVAIGLAWHWRGGANDSYGSSSGSPAGQVISPAKTSNKSSATAAAGSVKNPSAGAATSSAALTSPYGTYASNHSPSTANQTEISICTTTAGATCQIEFSGSGVTKSLPAETTNADGTASWTWSPRQYDLSAGSWKITMVATLNSQTKSSSDVILLQVP